MDNYPMTVEGEKKLRAEHTELTKVVRPRIIHDIAVAREHGDLKENAEYHAAREQQGFCEGRIQEIEGKLAYAQVIDLSKITPSNKVIFGVTVTLLNVEKDEEVTYKIVGEDEADIKLSKISITSPIARGLIGKELDDEVMIRTPAGEVAYEIIDVQYI